MDIRIDSIGESVVEALHAAGYMDSTIRVYRKYFRYLKEASGDGLYTEEQGRRWVGASKPDGSPYCENVVGFRRRIVGIADAYADNGHVDLSVRSYEPARPMPESPALLDVLADYGRDDHARGLARGTCDYYWRLAREYAVYLERHGTQSIEDADVASVLGFVADIMGRRTGTDGQHLATNFRPFLKFLGRRDLTDALKMASLAKRHGIVPMLGDADEEALADACRDRLVPARDAAITLLALPTGMRACDIIGLKTGDIDWRTSTLTIVQRKTGNPLTAPLLPAVAEALAEYILAERPDTEYDNVFVSTKAPHRPYRDHAAIYSATERTFRAAGVAGAGTLLLRHNAASRMLRSGAAPPVISAVLGHADPDTTNGYMEVDAGRMRACVLPLPKGAIA